MSEIVGRLAEACRPILVKIAASNDLIFYGVLATMVGPDVDLPNLQGRDLRLHNALFVLCEESYDEADNILLSAVVVRKDTEMPGAGFYRLARRKVGTYSSKDSEKIIFHAELQKVYEYYS